MNVIGLTGKAGCGKDTVADILVRNHGYQRIAFADPLRAMAYDLDPIIDWHGRNPVRLQEVVDRDGWDVAKRIYPEARRTLQRLGKEVIRDHVGYNFWVDRAMGTITSTGGRWVVTDCRFPNEAQAIKDVGGTVVAIAREGLDPLSGSHASEAGVGDVLIGAQLYNSGTLGDLEESVKTLAMVIGNHHG